MSRFRVYLTFRSEPIDVDLPFCSLRDLSGLASASRYLEGHLAEPDEEGTFAGVLIPTSRIQLIIHLS